MISRKNLLSFPADHSLCHAAHIQIHRTSDEVSSPKWYKLITRVIRFHHLSGEHGKATWFYIDEVHVLLNSPFSAEYLRQMWKKVRKQGGLCTGITQNIVDLLMSETGTTMLSNSAFILLLNQSSKDIEKIVEALEISEEQLNYVIDSPSGCGLIKCGSRMVPFDNVIDKDSELYRLYNTNLYEKMENSKEDE